jgi:hypothetical protein
MGKIKVGLYLGVDSLGGVVISNGKVISSARYTLASLEEESHVENLSDEVKWEALINKCMREMNVEIKDFYLSMADRDFIFRFFEMPLMKRHEIQSSVTYEIEKYIPFKLEELRWDYSTIKFPKEKKTDVSFLGLKEDIYQNIQGLFTRLGLNPVAFEPSAVSLARTLKTLKKFAKIKNFALLDLTGGEGYLTFFHYDLPVFNRYFTIQVAKDSIPKLEEVVNPVRLSFQYFRREFSFYKLDQLIIVSNTPDGQLVTMLKEELQTDVQICCPDDFIAGGNGIESLKAMGVADAENSAYKFKPLLSPTAERIERAKVEVPLNRGMLLGVAALCALVYTASFFYNEQYVAQKNVELTAKQRELVVPAGLKSGWSNVEKEIAEHRANIGKIKVIKDGYTPIGFFMEKLIRTPEEQLVPEGLWLGVLGVQQQDGKWNGTLEGKVYLDDARKEREMMDGFVYSLGRDAVMRKVFTSIELVSSSRGKDVEFQTTNFNVTLAQK